MIDNIINIIKNTVFNKSFLLGIIMAVGMFSHYIFGANNLAEEMVETIHRVITGVEIDFTPHVPEK